MKLLIGCVNSEISLVGFDWETGELFVGVHFVESHAQHEAARRLFSRGGGRAN